MVPLPRDEASTVRLPALIEFLVVGLLLTLVLMPLMAAPADGATSGQNDRANIRYEAEVPGPVRVIDTSRDGTHVAVGDDGAHFTFIAGEDATERSWQAEDRGALGDITPRAAGIAVADAGAHWAAAVAYESTEPGYVAGFASWSDQPVWRFPLGQSQLLETADQPTALAAGGPYYGVGTQEGHVYLLRADGHSTGGVKAHARHYDHGNDQTPFPAITALGISADGSRVVIGTAADGTPSLHVFSDKFFVGTFQNIRSPVRHIDVSSDSQAAVVALGSGAEGRIVVIDLQSGKTYFETAVGGAISAVAIADNGTTIAVGTDDGRASVYQRTGLLSERDPVQEHFLGSKITDIAMSDDGDEIVVAAEAGELLFLSPHRQQPLWSYTARGGLAGIGFAADGSALTMGARETERGRIIFTTADHSLSASAAPEPRVLPGRENVVRVLVGNDGNRMARVTADWLELPSRWIGSGRPLVLAPGETGTFEALVSVPAGQAADRYDAAVRLLPARDIETTGAEVKVGLRVPEMQSGQAAIAWSLPVAVPGGAPAAYLLDLDNLGNIQDGVSLGYAGLPAGWRAEYEGPLELYLNPGEDRDVVFRVFVPPTAPAGRESQFDLILAWDHGEERVPVRVTTVTVDEYVDALQVDGEKRSRDHADDNATVDPETRSLVEDLSRSLERSSRDPVTDISAAEEKESPALGAAALVGSVALLAWMHRRRR